MRLEKEIETRSYEAAERLCLACFIDIEARQRIF
jgi:hypothetical protein